MTHLSNWNWLLGQFSLKTSEKGLAFNGRSFDYPEIAKGVTLTKGLFFITLKWGDKTVRYLSSESLYLTLSSVLEARINYWRDFYLPVFTRLGEAATSFHNSVALRQRYLRSSELGDVINRFSEFHNDIKHQQAFDVLGFKLDQSVEAFKGFLLEPIEFQAAWNKHWIREQLLNNKTLFDELEDHPLTEKQRLSCIIDEDNVLVLAGAGTGKTSTMVAKVKYLVANGYAQANEIMMLAYGGDAQKELQERMDNHTELTAVKVSTFHSAGKTIINYHEKNTVSQLATDEKLYVKFVEDQIVEMLKDEESGEGFSQFVSGYLYPRPNGLDLKSNGEYLKYVKDNELRTLSGQLVKSFEELTIANYLFTHGIQFEYEKPYPFDVSEPGRGRYQPDFYLVDFDIYLEHFGINKAGETRSGIDAKKYNADIVWKKKIHHENETTLWETFSWQSHEAGGLTSVLEEKIKKHCIATDRQEIDVFKPLTPVGIYSKLKDLGLVSHFSTLIARFLSLFKASPEGLEALSIGELDPYNLARWALFKKLFSWVYSRYQAVLAENKTIDFADMIIKATDYIERSEFHQNTNDEFKLRYILVDEFQDISPIRASLVKALKQANTGCALMGVGDDWQAIYAFTGSDVRLTTDFQSNFGASEVLQLDKTFRFNDRIERVASTFVQNNPNQIPKTLTTHSKSYNPEVCIISNKKDEAVIKAMDAIGEPEGGVKPTVMLLSRFKRSLPDDKELSQRYPNFSFKVITAHGSKGKQADYVIVLDVIDDKWGFPSKVETDSLLTSLLPALDGFKFSEERRLFYVALSRAKQTVFLHTEMGRESEFIKELKLYKDDVRLFLSDLNQAFVEHARCPECLEGSLRPIEGKHSLFYACSLGQHYCKTIVRACDKCQSGPIVPSEHGYECASEQCDHKLERCPKCINGMLLERTNNTDGSSFYGCSNYRGRDKGSCTHSKRKSKSRARSSF